MDPWPTIRRNWLWLVAGAFMAALVATDTIVHLRTSWDITSRHISNPPEKDPASSTGYARGQRDFILPYVGMDGYHWVLQTQEMLAGAGLRVRAVDYDNAPYGREVHWSSSFRWWVAGLAWLDHLWSGDPIQISVENVMPYANTLLITLIILCVLPVVARRFGAAPAAILAVGMVAVSPVYIAFSEGKSDHHGLAVVTTMFTLLFLVAGGAGWVRATAAPSAGDTMEGWLLERPRARRWFIASGIAGGCGLWISAASQIPVLIEVGLGALLAGGWLARGVPVGARAKPDPSLWRVWGLSGAATSIILYLLEYFPSEFGIRLEVNHPLYALAWAGGGELLFRLCRGLAGGKLATTPRDRLWLAGAVLAVMIAPLAVAGFSGRVFWVADRFLFNFHEDYIAEFKSMARYLVELAWDQRVQVINPLMLLIVPLLLWIWRPLMACICIALFIVITIVAFVSRIPWTEAQYAWWLAALVAEGALLALFAAWPRPRDFSRPAKALLALTLLPGVFTYFLSMRHMRWMEIGYGLLLVALVAVAAILARRGEFRWTRPRLGIATFYLASVLVVSPVCIIQQCFKWNWQAPASDVEVMEIITRDVAQRLRSRLGDKVGVVISGPTTTTWMIYWGGFKGVGTLYWENLAGLKATGDIYAAMSDAEALDLVRKYGVTHFVIFPWDEFALPYARLKNNLRIWDNPPPGAFVLKLINTGTLPRWLRPLYYPMPANVSRGANPIYIWEVAPEQSAAESLVRQAQWWSARGNNGKAFELLSGVLKSDPLHLPALIAIARLAAVSNQTQLFSEAVNRIRTIPAETGSLSLNDQLDLAVVFQLARDETQLRQQTAACIALASDANLRLLDFDALYNLLTLARQIGMANDAPAWWKTAFNLLPAQGRAQVLAESASEEKRAGRTTRAVELLRQALALQPEYLQGMANLAWILATSPDDSVRNGREALAFAHRANELDKNQHLDVRDVLACAYAECGEFDLAVAIETAIAKAAEDNKMADLAKIYRERLALFQQHQSYREK